MGAVKPTIHLTVNKSIILKTKASSRPVFLAFAWDTAGNFPVMMEMKMMLSIPKIISITVKEIKAMITSPVNKCSILVHSLLCNQPIKYLDPLFLTIPHKSVFLCCSCHCDAICPVVIQNQIAGARLPDCYL